MYDLEFSSTLAGEREQLWSVWTDLTAYPQWDPREQLMRLDGPFAVGTTGFSKQTGPRPGSDFVITRVEPATRWTIETPLPGGKLVLDHLLETPAAHSVRVIKRYEVHGPMSLAFRLVFARGIRAQMPGTFAALEREVARRATA